jgi:hypothetical protein
MGAGHKLVLVHPETGHAHLFIGTSGIVALYCDEEFTGGECEGADVFEGLTT